MSTEKTAAQVPAEKNRPPRGGPPPTGHPPVCQDGTRSRLCIRIRSNEPYLEHFTARSGETVNLPLITRSYPLAARQALNIAQEG